MLYHQIVSELTILRIFQRHAVVRAGNRLRLSDLERDWRQQGLAEEALYQAIDRFESAKAFVTLLVEDDYYCYLGSVGEHCIRSLPAPIEAAPALPYELMPPPLPGLADARRLAA